MSASVTRSATQKALSSFEPIRMWLSFKAYCIAVEFCGMVAPGAAPVRLFLFQTFFMTQISRLSRMSLALAVATALTTPASAITTYDGVYRVDVTTTEGDCTRAASGTVTVVDGLIPETSDPNVRTFGRIGEDGVVSFAFHRGTDVAHLSGRLKGGRGQGAWSAPTQLCGGSWKAQKIK